LALCNNANAFPRRSTGDVIAADMGLEMQTVGKISPLKLSFAIVLVAAMTSFATQSFALGSAEERAACTPDVFRLCSSEIPNVDRIVACMKRETPRLSPGCRAVFHPEQAAK